ncbi:MAG: OmpH family outer membrane protein [Bacteroidetes bacterium]|nr:OmpH family outer membrane protein [Bacteroidota bacterium]
MKKLLKISLLVFLIAFTADSLKAQKFGHLNSGNLLIQIPATKIADDKLKVLQDSMVAVGEARAKALQEEFNSFMKVYNEGSVTPAESQKKQAEFERKQQELAAYEDEIIALINKKRDELLAPILAEVQKAIDAVGKEGGYTMIFDTSVFNTILFAQDSDDVEPLVKVNLGIK